jgi:hypothetical protein
MFTTETTSENSKCEGFLPSSQQPINSTVDTSWMTSNSVQFKSNPSYQGIVSDPTDTEFEALVP